MTALCVQRCLPPRRELAWDRTSAVIDKSVRAVFFYVHCINHCGSLWQFFEIFFAVCKTRANSCRSSNNTPSTRQYTYTNLLHVITVQELPHDITGLLRLLRVDPVATIINRL